MNTNRVPPAVVVVLAILSLFVLLLPFSADAENGPFQSPLSYEPTPAAEDSWDDNEWISIARNVVAQRQDLPVELMQVGFVESLQFPVLADGAQSGDYIGVTLYRRDGHTGEPWKVYVNATTGQVLDDLTPIRADAKKQYWDTYGTLNPALYDRLLSAKSDEAIPVAFWLKAETALAAENSPKSIIAARYPEAATALRTLGVLWAVDNADLSTEIQQAYESEITKANESLVIPFIADLKIEGVVGQAVAGLPVVAANLTPSEIRSLSVHKNVDQVYLADTPVMLASNVAVPASHIRGVLSTRYMSGSGVKLAILERGNLSPPATTCLGGRLTDVRVVPTPYPPTPTPSANHKNRVAVIAACNSGLFLGAAPNVLVIDAGHEGISPSGWMTELDALQWATQIPGPRASIVNQSEQVFGGNSIEIRDRAYDYWVSVRNFTAVISAGNQGDISGGYVTTPAKGYNVITVGNADDHNTIAWADDNIFQSSSYGNPWGGPEKPEVVAPGTEIDTSVPLDDGRQPTGTSFAAPQVSGVVALLMERDALLKTWPSAVKAIVMASAVHNVDHTTGQPDYLSDKDGAGMIDAMVADTIAQTRGNLDQHCDKPCWWGWPVGQLIPGQDYKDFYVTALNGEMLRVAVSWLADANAYPHAISDLLSNYDLTVYDPNDALVTVSNSDVNNFEIVEFRAPRTGIYRLRLSLNANSQPDASNMIGVAWSKQALYVPDIRDDNAFTSYLVMKSEESTTNSAFTTFLHWNGAVASAPLATITPNAQRTVSPIGMTQGSAVLNGHEDLVVVHGMTADAGGQATFDNVFRPPGFGDPEFETVANTLYAPSFYKNIFGGISSTLDVLNSGTNPTNVTAEFIGRDGYGNYGPAGFYLPAGGHFRIDGSTIAVPSWVGSLKIQGDQPLAARILDRDSTNSFARSYGAAARGYSLLYSPVGYKCSFSLTTGIVLQNVGADPVGATIYFMNRAGNVTDATHTISNLGSMRAVGINLTAVSGLATGWTGSIKVAGPDSSLLVAEIINTSTSQCAAPYTTIGSFASTAVGSVFAGRLTVLPHAIRNMNGRNTVYMVRNVSGTNNTVTARYYDSSGSLMNGTPFSFLLTSAQTTGYAQMNEQYLPASWQGSIVLESTGPIVAIMREDGPNTVSGYNGVVLSQ